VKGKDYWFGPGKGVSDLRSYRAALDRYRVWQAEREQDEADEADVRTAVRVLIDHRPVSRLNIPELVNLLADRTHSVKVHPSNLPFPPPEPEGSRPPEKADQEPVPADPSTFKVEPPRDPEVTVTIGDPPSTPSDADRLIDEYLAEQERRRKLTENSPAAIAKRDRLGASGLRNQRNSAEALRRHFHKVRLRKLDSPEKLERALLSFRQGLDFEVAAG